MAKILVAHFSCGGSNTGIDLAELAIDPFLALLRFGTLLFKEYRNSSIGNTIAKRLL